MLDQLAGFFFGRDVFVSYSYDDSPYAEALAVALQKRKLSVFLGGWGASVSDDLSPNVVRAARRCGLLAVVATHKAVSSTAVQQEIDIVSKRQRTVVPINVGGAIIDRHKWPGTDPVAEEPGVSPSEHVIERIENAAEFVRQEVRLRRFISAVAVAAILLIAGSAVVTRTAESNRSLAESAAAMAYADVDRARIKLKSISTDLKAAEAEKRRQSAITTAIQMANDANLVIERQPARLTHAALLAAASVRRLQDLGVRSLGADTAIRAVAALLPVVRRIPLKTGPRDFEISRNGRFMAVANENGSAVIVYDVAGGHTLRTIEVRDGRVAAISNDGKTVVAKVQSEMRIWRDGVPISTTPWPHELALSDDGNRIATLEWDQEDFIRIRNVDGSGIECRTNVLPENIHTPEFSPSGHLLAINGYPAAVWAWETDAEPKRSPMDGQQPWDSFTRIIFNPANEFMAATIGGEHPLEFWYWGDWSPGLNPIWRDAGSSTRIDEAAFSSDGESITYVASDGEPREARWGYIDSPSIQRLVDGGDASARGGAKLVAADKEAGHFAVAYKDGTVTEFKDGRPMARVTHPSNARGLAFSDGEILSVTPEETLRWKGAPIGYSLVKGWEKETRVDGISPNGKFKLAYSATGVSVVPVGGGRPTTLPGTLGSQFDKFISDTRVLTKRGDDVKLWSWPDRRVVWRKADFGASFFGVDPSGRFLAGAINGRDVAVFSMEENGGKPISVIPASDVWGVGFSQSGELLMINENHERVHVWSGWATPTPVEVSRLAASGRLGWTTLSEDGRYLNLWIDFNDAQTERFLWRDADFLPPVCARLEQLIDPADRPLYLEACAPKNPAAR